MGTRLPNLPPLALDDFTADTLAYVVQGGVSYRADLGDIAAYNRVAEGPLAIFTKTATGPITLAEIDSLIVAIATGGAFTLTLPASAADGSYVIVTKYDGTANQVTVNNPSAQLIGRLSKQYDSLNFVCVSGAWTALNPSPTEMATQTIKGRATAGTGTPEDLTASQVKTILSLSNVENKSSATIRAETGTPVNGTTGAFSGAVTLGSTLMITGNTTFNNDAQFAAAKLSGNPIFNWDNNDFTIFDRSANAMIDRIAGTDKLTVASAAVTTGTGVNLVVNGTIRCGVYTFATLPSAAASGVGTKAHCSDSNSATFNTVTAGSGGNSIPVFVDNAPQWRNG